MAGIFAQSALQIGATQQPNLNLCPDWQGTVWQTISETLVLRMGPLMAVMAYLYLLVGFFQPFIKVTLRTVPRSNKIIIIVVQGAKKVIFKACRSGKLKLAYTRPNTISTRPKNISMSSISQFFCNLNYCKNFTSVQQPMTLHYKSLKDSN